MLKKQQCYIHRHGMSMPRPKPNNGMHPTRDTLPLMFQQSGWRQYLFLREFDDALDDYQDAYRVFSLPGLSDEVIESSWLRIKSLATAFLGEVSVAEVQFDASRRKEIETAVIDKV